MRGVEAKRCINSRSPLSCVLCCVLWVVSVSMGGMLLHAVAAAVDNKRISMHAITRWPTSPLPAPPPTNTAWPPLYTRQAHACMLHACAHAHLK